MLNCPEDRLLHSLTTLWMTTNRLAALSISPIFLNVSLQYAYSMTERKRASGLDELVQNPCIERQWGATAAGQPPTDVQGDEKLTPENVGRSDQFSETLFAYEPNNRDTVCLDGNHGDNVTDVTCSGSDIFSSNFNFPVQSPGDNTRVQNWVNNAADMSSAPFLCSSSDNFQQHENVSRQHSSSSKIQTLAGFFNNETLNTYSSADQWPLQTKLVDSRADAPKLKHKSRIHSCPDLHSRGSGSLHTPDASHVAAYLPDWFPMEATQSVILEGVDENQVFSRPGITCYPSRSSLPRKGENSLEPAATSSGNIVEISGQTLSYTPAIVIDNSKAALENDHTTTDEYVHKDHSGSTHANGILMQTISGDQSGMEPSDEGWNNSPERRGSTSALLSGRHESRRGQHEHIELLSMSPTQRKRHFRRKRSLSLPKRSQSRKSKSGKTNKLCKKKKGSAHTAIETVLLHSGPVSTYGAISSSVPASTMKGQDRRAAKNHICASLLCAGLHSSWKECITTDGSRVPLVVLSEIDTVSSVGNGSPLGHSNTTSTRAHAPDDMRCLHIRRRSSVDKVRGIVVDGGEFTVVPVNNETNLLQQSAASSGQDNISRLRVPLQLLDIDGEPGDTLTQNSITSLLSAKFRDVAKRWRQYGVDSPRFRKRLHSKWESMNYEQTDSQLQRTFNQDNKSKKQHALNRLSSWVIYFFIGVGTAFMAAGVQISVEIIAQQKFMLIRDYLDKCSREDCLFQPVIIWISFNLGITLLGSALVTYVQPMAAGSGIPLIKSYLNGVRIPGLLSLRAFLAKCLGVILSILGGLACGKEGPMAHSGGIVAAGLGKGRIPWFNKYFSLYGLFRNDHNIRDLVAAGAASGVSAAFGAPVGGTLFSVEEAASFWNTELVWKVFFSAMIACFSTNVLLSAFEGHPTQLSNPGLVRFNTFPNLTFDLIEIPVFIIMAAIGGLIGSLFVVMNYKLTVFRQKYLHRKKWIKVVEAGLVAVVSAIVAFVLMLSVKDCTTAKPYTHHAITTKMGCSGESHNSLSTLFLTTPEGCLKALLHDPLESYSVVSLVLFVTIFFLLGVWTYGLSVSSGVFIPSLAIGAAWGRLIGMGVVQLFPDQAKDVGKYALIGAASQLGGILRTTISLTVIIVECTGDITFGLCIMISLMISKWVGDFFTTGLYDMNIEVSGIPLLSWEPPPLCGHIYVNDFMSQPVMTLLAVEKVGHIYDCLTGETFHGFPVIEQDLRCEMVYKGKLKGIILRHQILVLLQKRVFCPEGQVPNNSVVLEDFENSFSVSQSLKIEDIELSDADKECVMNLTPYMNQSPYTVTLSFSMPRVFRLFRGLGLRHLVVVNTEFEPIGMVTRKDLAKYRAEIKKGLLHMEQLTVEDR